MGITVSNTSGNGGGGNYIRVYLNGLMVAEVQTSMRQPLTYVRQCGRSKYIQALWQQCQGAGMVRADFLTYVLNRPVT